QRHVVAQRRQARVERQLIRRVHGEGYAAEVAGRQDATSKVRGSRGDRREDRERQCRAKRSFHQSLPSASRPIPASYHVTAPAVTARASPRTPTVASCHISPGEEKRKMATIAEDGLDTGHLPTCRRPQR